MAAPVARRRHRTEGQPGRRQNGQPRAGRRVASITAEKERLKALAAKTPDEVAKGERKPIKAFKIGPNKPVRNRRVNMMVYGPWGHGKTTFAGSADDVKEMQDILYINSDAGTMSLTHRRTMDFININKYVQVARIFEYLTLHCYLRDEGTPEARAKLLDYERELKDEVIEVDDQGPYADPETKPVEGRTWFEEQRLRSGKPMDEPYFYRTVVVDSINELHRYLVYKFTGVDIGVTKLDEDLERMEEWQEAQELFRLFIRSFRDLPVNSIFVCAEDIASGSESDRKKGRKRGKSYPKLPGSLPGDVAGFLDVVGYLEREIEPGGDTHRYLYLGAGYEGWISKHRFENLPDLDYVEDPNLASLIDLARKDAEAHASPSNTKLISHRVAQPPSSNSTRPTASVRRRTANAPAGSGRRGARNTVRRSN